MDTELRCSICNREESHDPHNRVWISTEDMHPGNLSDIMNDKKCCFNCAFWIEKIQLFDEHTYIVDGTRYHGSGELSGVTRFAGHGGRKFYIKMKDGSFRYTNNLWRQGDVPEEWRKYPELQDNATFIKEDEYERGIAESKA